MELEHSEKEKTHFKDPSQPLPVPAAATLPVTTSSSASSAEKEPTAAATAVAFTSANNQHHHVSCHPIKIAQPTSTPSPSPSSIKEETEATEYDSDCLVIVECDPADYHLSPGDGQEMSQGSYTGSGIHSNPTGESQRTDEGTPNSKTTSNAIHINNNNNHVGKKNNHHNPSIDESHLSSSSNYSHHKLHNLPIHELKKKLAYCPICEIQCTNHKIANLCLNKHGMRQCWLCLDVIPNTKDSYFHHCVTNHAVRPSSDMVACPYCQKFFDFRQGINQHIVKVHFSEDTSFFSTTACLSPGSLVDIYTGQSRSNSNGSSSGGIGNNNSNTNSNSNSNNNDPPLPPLSFQDEPIPSSSYPSVTTTFRRSSEEDDSSSIVLKEIKIIRNTQEGVGGTVSQLSLLRRPPNHRAIAASTRESVIRETSSWFEGNTAGRLSSSSSYMQTSAMERESHLNSSRRPQSNPHPSQTQTIQSQPDGNNSLTVVCMGESNLTLPQRPSSDPLHPSSFISLFPSPSSSSTDSSQTKPNTQPVEYNVEYYNTPQSINSLSGGGLTSYHHAQQSQLTQNKKSPFPQSNSTAAATTTFHRDSSLAALQDFQKMLEESEATKATAEYLNSVKSMLKTVADYGPQDHIESESGVEIPNHHQHHHHHHHPSSLGLYTNTGGESSSSDLSRIANLTPDSSRSLGGESEDHNHFKVPSHAGVKRRILTKWDDQHQEKKVCEPGSPSYYGGGGGGGNTLYPPPLPSNLEKVSKYHQHSNYHHQPFSLEGSLRAPGGLHDMPPEDQQFWEQILRESSAMHKSPQAQDSYQRLQEFQFRVSLHQQQQQAAGAVHSHHQSRSEYYSTGSGQHQHQQFKSEGDTSYLTHILPRGGGGGESTNSANNNRQFPYNNGLLNHNQHSNSSPFLHEQTNPSPTTGETITTSSQLMLYNPVQAHKQYEYRIIPQSTSGGTVVPNHANEILNSHPHPVQQQQQQETSGMVSATPTTTSSSSSTHYNTKLQQNFPLNYHQQQHHQIQSDLSTPRKRKSSFPNRVIQQPKISPGDSVVVQNPFEEEEVTFHNQIRQPINNNNLIPLSPNSRKPKYTPGLACHRVSSTSTLMTHPLQQQQSSSSSSSSRTSVAVAAAQFDAVQIHQQQLLQHQQNVQIQINHHHYNQSNRLSNITPVANNKLPSPEFLYQQQQQQLAASRMKSHSRRSSLDNRVAIPMMSPVPQGQRNNSFHFESPRSSLLNGGGPTGVSSSSRSHSKANGNREASNNDSWPFAIAPRYQDRCRTIAIHVKEMEMQQKLREKCKRNLISSSGEGENTHLAAMWQ